MCHELDFLYNDSMIATEALSLSSIKQTAKKIIITIKEAFQRLMNWISSRFVKLLNMENVTVNQKYYNDIMSLIKSVLSIDTISIEKVLMDINTYLSNEDKVKKYGDILAKKLQELDDYAENLKKITPSEEGKTLTFSAAKLKSFKSNLMDIKDSAYKKMIVIAKTANNPNDSENLKYSHTQIVYIGRMAAIDMKKSTICINLIEKLMSHCTVNSNNKDNGGETVDEHVKQNYETTERIGIESLVAIAEEKFSDAKKIYANNLKTLEDKINHASQLPENTVEEIDEKINIYSELVDISYKACKELRQVKPGNVDKFLSGISFIVSNTVDMVADTSIRSSAYNLKPDSPNLSQNAKNIVSMVGVKWIARLIDKGTIRERMQKVNDIIDKMVKKNTEYNQELTNLRQKKRQLIEKEKESAVTESFIKWCDEMMIAEE